MMPSPPLSELELSQYSRHLTLQEIGIEGQQKLKSSRVLCIGIGGLGNATLLYLTSAGIGTLGLVDHDVVDRSNLPRQILFAPQDIGSSKTKTAAKKLKLLNPNVEFIQYPVKLTDQNALKIISNYDLVVDCSDNFSTRYLINDACFQLKKPNVSASIDHFAGICSIFTGYEGPCYRCLYPTVPPDVGNCQTTGVLGVVPGLFGILQATETVKLLLNMGSTLIGEVLSVDLKTLTFKKIRLLKNPHCSLCSSTAKSSSLNSLNAFSTSSEMKIKTLSAFQLKKLQKQKAIFLLDVREEEEYALHNLGGYLIPLKTLENRLVELNKQDYIVVHCKNRNRSLAAAHILKKAGFQKIAVLEGGITAWEKMLATKRN